MTLGKNKHIVYRVVEAFFGGKIFLPFSLLACSVSFPDSLLVTYAACRGVPSEDISTLFEPTFGFS